MRKIVCAAIGAVLCVGAAWSSDASAALAFEEGPTPPPTGCTGEPRTTCHEPWTKRVTIGPGLPAVSFRFDGKIGVLDKVVPLELGLNYKQQTAYSAGAGGATRVVFWRLALGITFGKSPDQDGAAFGAYFMPWGLQVNNFSAGVAVAYSAVGELQMKNQNWSIVLPVSYAVQL